MMKLARCNEWMFRTVKCRAYMKKVNDGRYIQEHKNDGSTSDYTYILGYDYEKHEDITKDVGEPEGALDMLKTYYERTEKEFVGVVVGMKMVTVTGFIYADTDYVHGREYTYVGKQPKDKVKCALVYYGCNKSRLVPIEDIEIVEEE